MKTILKVIVGSQAHGLATPDSDFDYRGVFVTPTTELLKLGSNNHTTSWIEGKDDDTSWEIGHFLNLAVHSNPTILETFLAPIVEEETGFWGGVLRTLFPYVWSSEGVMNAFIGYGQNQRKKFFDNKDNRAQKYAVAYLRTLYQGWELLNTGTFTIRVADIEVIGTTLKKWKAWTPEQARDNAGEVIESCLYWEKKVQEAYQQNPNKKTNLEAINGFLIDIRKDNWL